MINNKGFSVTGLLVTVVIVAILAIAIFIMLDPVRRIGEARDEVRRRDILLLTGALNRYINENNGVLPITAAVTTDKKVLCSSVSSLTCDGDTQDCITITDDIFFAKYIATLPVDPAKSADTDTGYYITKDANNIVALGACASYSGTISVTTTIKEFSPAPPSCAGYYDGTYCWFGAAAAFMSCDQVCAANGLTCVNENWNDDASCSASKGVWGAGACVAGCATMSYTFYPARLAIINYCTYRSGAAQSCSTADSIGANRLCACE